MSLRDREQDPYTHSLVERETWGHLMSDSGKFNGYVLFTHGVYGDNTVIDCVFDGVPDSPWFCRALHDYVADHIIKKDCPGGIWRFDGYVKIAKNGRITFHGKIRPMRVQYRFGGRS